ncbi:MAG: DoxX family protein [Bacteroidia bacterium]
MLHLINIKHRIVIKEYTLLFFRVGISVLMIYGHGYGKLLKLFSGEDIQFADPIGLGVKASFYLVVFAEVLCSVLIMFGLKTRLAAMVLVVNMFVAAVEMFTKNNFPELALMYLLSYLLILIFGAGKFSVDYTLNKKTKRKH